MISTKHRKIYRKVWFIITLLADEDKKMAQDYGVWQLKKFMGKRVYGSY